jgi:hypothetical protein
VLNHPFQDKADFNKIAESQRPNSTVSFLPTVMPSNDDAKNAGRLRMLLAEIDSGEAMMALVKTSRDPKAVRQYRENALQTYHACMRLILGISMSHQQDQEVWNRLAPIRHCLETAGLLRR